MNNINKKIKYIINIKFLLKKNYIKNNVGGKS